MKGKAGSAKELRRDPLSARQPPAEPEPQEYCCRYCDHISPSAQSCSKHAAKRHPGVGRRPVLNVDP